MREMFFNNATFNQPIGNWDVSSVTYMGDMFRRTTAFNQPIGNWDVSSITNMEFMFRNAESFNQDIGNWDVSSVTTMLGMFLGVLNLAINWRLTICFVRGVSGVCKLKTSARF